LRRALILLLTALVLVQTVGVLHRVVHAQQSAGVFSHAASAVATEEASFLVLIWGDHSSSAECQLFDQACPDLLHLPVWALLVLAAVPTWVAATLSERFALFERFYAARGPPAVLL
jgi:hypothetical protein